MKNILFFQFLVLACIFSLPSRATGLGEAYAAAEAANKDVNSEFKNVLDDQRKLVKLYNTDISNSYSQAIGSWNQYSIAYCSAVSRIYGGAYVGPHQIECDSLQMELLVKIMKAQKAFESSYGSAVALDQELVSKVNNNFKIQIRNASALSMFSLNDSLVESQSKWSEFVTGYCSATGKVYGKSNYQDHEILCKNFIENLFLELNNYNF